MVQISAPKVSRALRVLALEVVLHSGCTVWLRVLAAVAGCLPLWPGDLARMRSAAICLMLRAEEETSMNDS